MHVPIVYVCTYQANTYVVVHGYVLMDGHIDCLMYWLDSESNSWIYLVHCAQCAY